jgi:hypothetical protein
MNLAVVVFDFMGLVKDNNFKIPKTRNPGGRWRSCGHAEVELGRGVALKPVAAGTVERGAGRAGNGKRSARR